MPCPAMAVLQDYPAAVRGMRHPLFFLDHQHPEGGAGRDSRSRTNLFEVAFCVALAKYLLQQGYTAGQ